MVVWNAINYVYSSMQYLRCNIRSILGVKSDIKYFPKKLSTFAYMGVKGSKYTLYDVIMVCVSLR
jgi:hypothetical protein